MRAKPLSPLSFSNSTYPKLLLLLLPLLIAVTLVSATVFVYYPVGITANWVNPPVVFTSQGVSTGVTVTLYDDATRADIDVASPGILSRTERHAFIYDDFSTDPFADGRLTRNTNAWSWNPAGYIEVSADGPSGSWGGEHVAYYLNTIPPGTSTVYVLSKERHVTTANRQHMGLTMISSENSFYTLEYYRGARNNRLRMYRYTGLWTQISQTTLNLQDNEWFIFLGSRAVSSGLMTLTVYDNGGTQQGSLSGSHTGITVSRVGLGIRDETSGGGSLSASFDDFVACADANPRFVTVTGLQNGWTVYLYQGSSNTPVASATAGPSGVVALDVLTKPIIRNARFEIKYGDITILPSQSFDVVVGGDVYACNIRDMNILGFTNQDSKAYKVYVEASNLQAPSDYSGSINLWAGSSTTPIRILGDSILQGTTSDITLDRGATGYIHGTFSLSPPSTNSVVITLVFHYYIPDSGVEVEYPITVRVHS